MNRSTKRGVFLGGCFQSLAIPLLLNNTIGLYILYIQYKRIGMILELHPRTVQALNSQYSTRLFDSLLTPSQLVQGAQQAMQQAIDAIDYELTPSAIQCYAIATQVSQ